ncbi:MAG: nuclease superfamily [Actinomycetia bacterium]|nr:nuclease superfamily [Actinomycetes bacterium]
MSDKWWPDIIGLSPTALEQWLRCPRETLLGRVLGLPESDPGASPDRGLFVHNLLHQLHAQGSCHDAAHVDDLLTAYGLEDDSETRGILERHARRCPHDPTSGHHEVDLTRFYRKPPVMFMASARIDALWIVGDVLDARDYKTGFRAIDRVADDPKARLQAWVLARFADRKGLQLRLRWEYLATEVDEDPEPFVPDDDDIDAIGVELAAVVTAMRADDAFTGHAEPELCARCRYRSLCSESLAPGEPSWPAVLLGSSMQGS